MQCGTFETNQPDICRLTKLKLKKTTSKYGEICRQQSNNFFCVELFVCVIRIGSWLPEHTTSNTNLIYDRVFEQSVPMY